MSIQLAATFGILVASYYIWRMNITPDYTWVFVFLGFLVSLVRITISLTLGIEPVFDYAMRATTSVLFFIFVVRVVHFLVMRTEMLKNK